MADIQFNTCPNCGGTLEGGYLIGKNHQIRWSKSAEGMTVFHGVPLMHLEKGFWRKWQSWSYAPSIAAVRPAGWPCLAITMMDRKTLTTSGEQLPFLAVFCLWWRLWFPL
jgi:hypothetical protein